MVKAVYTINGNKHSLRIQGHANYAEYGKDIVCAGVSSLIQALMVWVEEKGYTAEDAQINVVNGTIEISCVGADDVSAVFYMTFIGLEQIASSYPGYVNIKIISDAD